jgi:hypothetical protein
MAPTERIMSTGDERLTNVLIPAALADELTTRTGLAEWGSRAMPLRLGDTDLGDWAIVSLRAEYDQARKQASYHADLNRVRRPA